MTDEPTESAMTDAAQVWAVHVIGLDDLLACVSRRLAARNALWMNLGIAGQIERLDDPAWPLAYAVPAPWPHSAEGHAESLAEEEELDAQWSDDEVDVVGNLARQLWPGAGRLPLPEEETP